jgi:rod shape-determining protein MreD
VGLVDGAEGGTRYGFAAGLVVDLVSGGLMGVFALVYLLVGFASGAARPFLTGAPLVGQVVVGALGGGAAVLLYGVLALLFAPEMLTMTSVVAGTLVAVVMSAVLAPFVIVPVSAVLSRLEAAGPQ